MLHHQLVTDKKHAKVTIIIAAKKLGLAGTSQHAREGQTTETKHICILHYREMEVVKGMAKASQLQLKIDMFQRWLSLFNDTEHILSTNKH